jgi:hypothetical protein
VNENGNFGRRFPRQRGKFAGTKGIQPSEKPPRMKWRVATPPSTAPGADVLQGRKQAHSNIVLAFKTKRWG